MNFSDSNSDLSLFKRTKDGDILAFEILFRRYYPILCAYCKRFVNLEDAEEIVQDVLLWLWKERNKILIETESFHLYLFRAVHNKALNRLSHNSSQQNIQQVYYEKHPDILENTDYSHLKELITQIDIAVKQLPDNYRQTFVMHRFQDMSYKDIAQSLNISTKTVDYRIRQAIKMLQRKLKDYLS